MFMHLAMWEFSINNIFLYYYVLQDFWYSILVLIYLALDSLKHNLSIRSHTITHKNLA